MHNNLLHPHKIISLEYDMLLGLLRRGVGGGEVGGNRFSLRRHPDWDGLKNLAVYHEVVPFIYPALKTVEDNVPEDVLTFFRDIYYRTVAWCQHLWTEFLRVENAFRESGIDILPIKGVALLNDLYSSCLSRTMSDIDVLVREADLAHSAQVLERLNYRQELHGLKKEYWRERHYHLVFQRIDRERDAVLELHWMLDYKRRGGGLLPEMWERKRFIDAQGVKTAVLSAEDTFFCMALHLRRFGKMHCLKNILDICLLLEKYKVTFDWDYVLKEAARGKMRSIVYFALAQANTVFPGKFFAQIAGNLPLPDYKKELIRKFITGNSFSSLSVKEEKTGYLLGHFLLFDGLSEPVRYIVNIPHEQFCHYYALKPYTGRSIALYRFRFLFIPLRLIISFFLRRPGQE